MDDSINKSNQGSLVSLTLSSPISPRHFSFSPAPSWQGRTLYKINTRMLQEDNQKYSVKP